MMSNIQLLLAQHRARALDIVNGYLEAFSSSSDEKTQHSLEAYRGEVENRMYTRIAMDLTATIDKMDAIPSAQDYETGTSVMQEAQAAWVNGLDLLNKQLSNGHLR